MFTAEKRIKLSRSALSKINKNDSSAVDFTDSGLQSRISDSTHDFSLPHAKEKGLDSREASKLSLDSVELQSSSSGYSSLLSSCSSTLSHTRSPKKRKSYDENALCSVSPPKKQKPDDRSAKRVLKEKCRSENIILSSTPILNKTSKSRFGKVKSFHTGNFEIGKSLEEFLPPQTVTEEHSENLSSFEFSGHFDLTQENSTNIPSDLQKLWSEPIKAPETVTKEESTELIKAPGTLRKKELIDVLVPSPIRRFYNGREHCDIIMKLHQRNFCPPLDEILGYLGYKDLLNLSHVSKDYHKMIKANKTFKTKRQNYLKTYQTIRENVIPGEDAIMGFSKLETTKFRKTKHLGEINENHSMTLRPKPVSPPVSPSRRRFHENQKVVKYNSGPLKKCPRCSTSAIIQTIKIRRSPRKRKSNVLKLSVTNNSRVYKRSSKSFLEKPSIDTQRLQEQLTVTFQSFDEPSTSDSSSIASPSIPSSDDSSGCESHETEEYKFAVCQGATCVFKFCVNCQEKYHPRQQCREIPTSPPRSNCNRNNSSIACSISSKRSLKRLIY